MYFSSSIVALIFFLGEGEVLVVEVRSGSESDVEVVGVWEGMSVDDVVEEKSIGDTSGEKSVGSGLEEEPVSGVLLAKPIGDVLEEVVIDDFVGEAGGGGGGKRALATRLFSLCCFICRSPVKVLKCWIYLSSKSSANEMCFFK